MDENESSKDEPEFNKNAIIAVYSAMAAALVHYHKMATTGEKCPPPSQSEVMESLKDENGLLRSVADGMMFTLATIEAIDLTGKLTLFMKDIEQQLSSKQHLH
jgi:hypothetical protein